MAALGSNDPGRVEAALETLEFHHDTMEPVAVAAPRPDQLACFGDELPDEVVRRLVKLIEHHAHFAPALGEHEAAALAALAAVRFGPSWLALEASLVAKVASDPVGATRAALAAVAAPGVVRRVERAGDYVSYLLAGEASVRAVVVEVLAGWGADPELAAIRERVTGELREEGSGATRNEAIERDDDERARVGA